MTNVMLIDGNSIGFASHQSNKLTYDGKPVQAIFGIIKTLKRLKEIYMDYQPIVLWDGHSWRYDVYTDYKGNRKDPKMELMKQEYKSQSQDIFKALQLLGVKQVTVGNYEADDLGYLFAKKFVSNGKVVLISGDKDWLQMVQPGVFWHDPIRERKCTFQTFSDFTGCDNAQAFVDKKCLMGDTSDNIKGVGGIGENRALNLVQIYGNVELFLERDFEQDEIEALPKYYKEFLQNTNQGIDKYKQNRVLMDLSTPQRPKPEGVNVVDGVFDIDGFEEFCMEHGFSSIKVDLETYKKLFGGN